MFVFDRVTGALERLETKHTQKNKSGEESFAMNVTKIAKSRLFISEKNCDRSKFT